MVNFNGTKYGYIVNLQGDVLGLIDSTGAEVVKYTYDAWGKVLSTTGSLASTLGTVQPFRYRGYVYDLETGLYYLRSRYYNPNWNRFANADRVVYTVSCQDLYSYCDNNPVNREDWDGEWWHIVLGAFIGIVTQYVADVAQNIVEGKSGLEILTPTSSIADYGAAAASGALAATGIGLVSSIAANAAISGTAYIIDCELEGEKEDFGDFLTATIIGGVAGAIGGRGADGAKLRGIVKTSQNVLKTAVSPKKIAMYSAKIAAANKTAVVSTIRTIAAGSFVNAVDAVRNNLEPLFEE